ncbi:phospholipase A(1) DAD1, chloroplastic-like [Senna tora]|uniref:Phospholipase A(1) DAD1, chloroplastic-like n=1 Tax=Senna tora TaxID=362788 RepID=A0A834TRH7_9FABA|nr:phospholipase A(1) DAD1, chloroplastic-like [Senna tora]
MPFNKSQVSWNRLRNDSSSQCNSPKLGHKWKQYQGINNWDGMLDPLDDILRREILRYGQFVQAAYRSFDFDTASSTYARCRYPKSTLLARSGVRDTGYRITRNLRATCGISLPKWVDKMPMVKFSLSSWIGYMAVCQDRDEIARLGRRDVVISLRGTATCLEWLENARAALTHLPDDMGGEDSEAMVERGFLSLYVSRTLKTPSLREMIRDEIKKIIQSYGEEPLSLTITGHSLGAALAILSAYDIAANFKHAPMMVTVVSFGGPRVGNESFRCRLEQSGTKILRIVNSDDVITKVPGFVARSDDVAENGAAHVGSLPGWLQRRVEDMRWVYADVGQELRLSSRESPYLKNLDLATCHDLNTYLQLVNGFVSSTCPYTSKPTQYTAQAWL